MKTNPSLWTHVKLVGRKKREKVSLRCRGDLLKVGHRDGSCVLLDLFFVVVDGAGVIRPKKRGSGSNGSVNVKKSKKRKEKLQWNWSRLR